MKYCPNTTIRFTIRGNADDPVGNPLPKIRMTRRQSWKPEVKRYIRWKQHVVDAYIATVKAMHPDESIVASLNLARGKKPIVLDGRRARMDIRIKWHDGHRADAENVFGSIADALFHNDKNLSGSFDFEDGCGDGSVDITISISEQRTCTQSKTGSFTRKAARSRS
jgi:hypothetical protein